jgi:putative AlgH/UPF0301 family transcriptional regulator
MAQGPWDSDDDVFYGYSEEYSDEGEEDSDDDFSVNPPPSPSAQLAASTSTGVARRHSSMLWNASFSSLALYLLCIEGGFSFNPRHIRNMHRASSRRRPSSVFSPTSFRKRNRPQLSPLLFAQKENINPDTDDWRDFRAKLVSRENNLSPDNLTPTANSSGWAYDAGYLIERGSLIISNVETTLGCHDLNQPYFHKAVVLLLDHDDAEFTKGILLNRPTGLQLSDEDIFYLDDDGIPEEEANTPHETNVWQMHFGGDIAGLYDEKPMIVCLHNVTRCKSLDDGEDMNDVVVKDVMVTSHHAARALVASGEASPEDFFVFFGFAGWDPGMLHEEIKRGSWTMVAANAPTIWNELQAQRSETNLAQAGFKMWHNLMEKIGKGNQDELGNELTHDNYFSDLMLKEWVTEMCLISRDDNEEGDDDEQEWIEKQNNMENVVVDAADDENHDSSLMDEKIFRALEAAQGGPIEVGTVVRGSSLQPSPYMLYNHALHKSTVVVFQDEEEFSLGLILNIPSNETYTLRESDGKHIAEMTIRYGGPSSAVDDDDETGGGESSASTSSPRNLIWLHCSQALQDLRIGAPLQKDRLAGIWTCTESQAMQAIELGHAFPGDFMLVEGFVVWEKEGGAGGVRGEVFEGNMEIVPTAPIPDIWQLLMSQTRLSLETLDNNTQLSHNAWNLAKKDSDAKVVESRHVFGSQVEVSQIADDAMRIWQVIFLLPFTDRKIFSKLTKDRYKLPNEQGRMPS